MKITIVTVVYNGLATIEETFQSVASQTYPRVEHIVVDGASSDGTLAIIQKYRHKIATFISEPDRGIYDAMNKGIGLATGEVLGFLNADDVYADQTVLQQVSEVFDRPDVDACYADLLYVSRTNLEKPVRYWKSRDYQEGLFKKGWMPAHPTFFVRRRIYEEYGGFDLNFRRQSDFDLTMRFLDVHKIKSVYVPRLFVKMRLGGMSNRSISGVVKGNWEAYRACKKNGLNVTPIFMIRKVLSRLPRYL